MVDKLAEARGRIVSEAKDFVEVFGSEAGRSVLQQLGNKVAEAEDPAVRAGRADMVIFILLQMERAGKPGI